MKKTQILVLFAMVLLLTSAESFARQYFDKNKDLLLANFDLKPDEDDVHAATALACMLNHTDLEGINYYAVAGAYGTQNDYFIENAVPDLYNTLFGAQNTNWTNAHANWDASVTRAKDKVKATLDAGGQVFVQEAGQSDFTYDVIQEVIAAGVALATIQKDVIVVQHSDWNEEKTTQWKLTWVKNNTDYVRIEDGNYTTNSTPGYKKAATSWLTSAKAASNPNTIARDFWTKADNICDSWTSPGWSNQYIDDGGVDFSDCSENWWIFDLGTTAYTVGEFWDRYVTNSTGGSDPIDDIVSVSVPGSVEVGTTVTVTVNYSASQARDVYVKFELDTDPWTEYVSEKKDVTEGSGTLTFNIDIPSTVPVADDACQFQTFITTNGGAWADRFDNIAEKDIDVTEEVVTGQTPFYGTALTIPGTIESEDYDNGGEGVAYHDTDAQNSGNEYRTTEGVDVEVCGEGGYNVGWAANDEWLEYTVNVEQAGDYQMDVRYASLNKEGTISVDFDGVDKSGSVSLPATGAWQTYETVSVTVSLDAGTQVMKVSVDESGINLNKISFTAVDGGGGEVTTETVTLSAINDAYLQGSTRYNNDLIRIEEGNRVGYLMFDLSGISGTITSAELNLECTGDAGSGVVNIGLGNTSGWTETTLSSLNVPTSSETLGSLNTSYNVGASYTWDLDVASIVAGGNVSFVVEQTSGNDAAFASKENSVTGPELVVTYTTTKSAEPKQNASELSSDDVKMYPNPVLDQLNIEFVSNASSNVFYQIVDLAGKVVFAQSYEAFEGQNKVTMDVQSIPEGTYFLKISSNDNVVTKKLIK